jgi:hypothetical protein
MRTEPKHRDQVIVPDILEGDPIPTEAMDKVIPRN